MKTDLVNPFIVATVNVLETMTNTKITVGHPFEKISYSDLKAVTGIIGMAGDDTTGNLLISFDKESILPIVSRMLMDEFLEINQDVIDAVGELTNMICGGAKNELSTHGLTVGMATPIVIAGGKVELQKTLDHSVLTIPFQTEEGEFILETNLAHIGKS